MGLVGHFEVEEAAKVLERISRGNRRDHFIPNEKFRLELKRSRGEFLYTKYHNNDKDNKNNNMDPALLVSIA